MIMPLLIPPLFFISFNTLRKIRFLRIYRHKNEIVPHFTKKGSKKSQNCSSAGTSDDFILQEKTEKHKDLKMKHKKLTIIIFLVGVGHIFEDGQDLFVGRSVLDGIPDSDGHRVTW